MTELDEGTVKKFVEGDQLAFQVIYESTSQKIYATVLRLVNNADDARDLTHDVFVRAYEKRGLLKEASTLQAWLKKMAVNLTINRLNRQRRWRTLVPQVIFHLKQQGTDFEQNNDGDTGVLKILQKLPEKLRLPLVLKEIEDYSYEDIANYCQIPVGTVRSRLSRGKQRLKEILEKEEYHA